VKRTLIRLATIAGCLAGAAACSDEGVTAPAPGDGLSFQLRGAVSAEYHASGSPGVRADGLPLAGSFAAAFPDSLGGLVIAGYQSDGATGDVFILQLPSTGPGEYGPCTRNGESGCHGRLFLGVDPATLDVAGGAYQVVSGTVSLTGSGGQRVRGTLELSLQNADGTETLTVSAGTLDVPLSADRLESNGVACLARNLEAGTNAPC
jgi:hypothetical protein